MSVLPYVFVLVSTLVSAQDYRPFNFESRKFFADTNGTKYDFSMAFDSARFMAGDSVYYNYFITRHDWVQSNCNWWGSPHCVKQDHPSWAGSHVIDDNAGRLMLFNLAADTLHFDFTISRGDTAEFFRDSLQRFAIVYSKLDTMSVLGYVDTVKTFTIHHSDMQGNIIHSGLHDFNLLLARDVGISSFFQVDSFPMVLKPLAMLGCRNPDLGMYQITGEMVYDYQVDDEFQFYYYQSSDQYNPNDYRYYRLYHILSRKDSQDSIEYRVSMTYYDPDTNTTYTKQETLYYYRHEVLDSIPFEEKKPQYSYNSVQTKGLYKEDHCGMRMWTLKFRGGGNMGYCPEEKCWGPVDGGGPINGPNYTYVLGLGEYRYWDTDNSPHPWQTGWGRGIQYFKKNGVSCGDIVTSVADPDKKDVRITVSPNPVKDMLTIRASVVIHAVTVFDVLGRQRLYAEVDASSATLDFTGFDKGVHFVRITCKDGQTVIKKVLVH